MKQFYGEEAIRMAALQYARHGKTAAELVSFIKRTIKVSRRKILHLAQEMGVTVGPERRLTLTANVIPFWRGLPVWQGELNESQQSRGGAA